MTYLQVELLGRYKLHFYACFKFLLAEVYQTRNELH